MDVISMKIRVSNLKLLLLLLLLCLYFLFISYKITKLKVYVKDIFGFNSDAKVKHFNF